MAELPRRPFGTSGLEVSAIGYGAGHIGDPALSEAEVDAILGAVIDAGINLIDTARSYGASEARIGKHLGPRRKRVLLSTKVGYGVEGHADWTGGCISAGIDRALGELATDCIDIVHLHSCPREVLERGDVIEALTRAVEAGKVRVPAYSGDNHDLAFAVGTGAFGAVQTSVNLADPWSARNVLPRARAAGLGVIAKRPLANAPWRFERCPDAEDLAEYWRRWQRLELARAEGAAELALRFAAFHPLVDAAIVGTRRPEHLRANLAALDQGDLDPALRRRLEAAPDWPGLI